MQKPTTPTFEVEPREATSSTAPLRSFAACAMLSAIMSLPASSGSVAALPR